MKFFAYYLPQYYETEYNNEWWGQGFTEWTHVANAAPLYKKHDQPQIPFDNNYYNLLDKATVEWQTNLMKEYKVDGLIYYHYFSGGQLLLEKPAENLLKYKNIDQPFFFCWANHNWYKATKEKKTLLMEQVYGDKEMWEQHFQYLLPFFQDARYEKMNNKPLFMIFNAGFAECTSIIDYFNKRCLENGFDGIVPIFTVSDKKQYNKFSKEITGDYYIHLRQPGYWLNSYKHTIGGLVKVLCKRCAKFLGRDKIRYVEKYKGNTLFRQARKDPQGKNIIRGLFCSWDNTPRHSYRGYIILPPNKQVFKDYLKSIEDDEYVFFNAWNEWAEGMMLEPTESNGYKYLSWIKEWKMSKGN